MLFIRLAWIILVSMASTSAFSNMKAAQKAFAEKDYPRAALEYFKALKERKKTDKINAEFGLAESLMEMGLLYSASKFYSHLVQLGASKNTSYFRTSLAKLGVIDYEINLGQSHVVQLFKIKIDPSTIPGQARGFYFYYKGIEAFSARSFKVAKEFFDRVTGSSPYYLKAIFHLGVIANISGDSSGGVAYFQKIKGLANEAPNGAWLTEQANLNIARIYYESKKYNEAIKYYALISRESDNWLQALFEAAWAFFIMEKANNTLGNIHTLHSPFFEHRFFPESYILQSITFLRLCRFDRVKESLKIFKQRYAPVLNDIKALLEKSEDSPNDFFKFVYQYRSGTLKEHKSAWAILDALSRTDTFKQAGQTIRNADRELAKLSRAPDAWQKSGLLGDLKKFLNKKKVAATKDTGKRLYKEGVGFYKYLLDLSEQTKLITAELLLGKVDALRSELNVHSEKRKENFIGGMLPLVVGEDLEYWPFEGEYWEDELGGYVFNIDSKCQ